LKFISWPMRKGVMWPLNCFLFRCGMLMVSIFSVASLLFSRFALWKGINKSTASRARQREGDIVNHDSEMCQQTSNNSHGHNSLGSRKKELGLEPRSQIPDPKSQNWEPRTRCLDHSFISCHRTSRTGPPSEPQTFDWWSGDDLSQFSGHQMLRWVESFNSRYSP